MKLIGRWIAASLALMGFAPAAQSAAGDPPAFSAVFERAFQPGFAVEETVDLGDGTTRVDRVEFKVFEIGRLTIKSGRICAADPFVTLGDRKPFTQAVPNGAFPVRLAVGFHPAGAVKDNRVSFARVAFSEQPVERWSMAVLEGQDAANLKPDEIFGYPVDAGTGSFYDPLANDAANAIHKTNPDAWEAWQTEGEANGPKVIGPYSFVLMQPMGDVNVAMFHSGWGDGFYASYFGFDAEGKVAALVTSFNTIDWLRAKW